MDKIPRSLQASFVKRTRRDADALYSEFCSDCLSLCGIVCAAADNGQVDSGLRQSPRQGHAYHTESAGDHTITTFQVIK